MILNELIEINIFLETFEKYIGNVQIIYRLFIKIHFAFLIISNDFRLEGILKKYA